MLDIIITYRGMPFWKISYYVLAWRISLSPFKPILMIGFIFLTLALEKRWSKYNSRYWRWWWRYPWGWKLCCYVCFISKQGVFSTCMNPVGSLGRCHTS